jgi:two-component system cell cycle sensor histidine kinase/response regulator CckA
VSGKDSHARDPNDAARTTSPKPLGPVGGARRGTLLVVDDEDSVRTVLRRYLDRHGWQVLEAANGEQALRLIEDAAVKVDAVIVDLNMPGMQGAGLCRRIAEARPALASRMIVASGDPRAAVAALALEEIACPVLAKPFELKELDRKLDAALGG